MAGAKRFPTQASVLDADALAVWAGRRYALTQPVSAWLHSAGVNDTYYVMAGGVQHVLRVYRQGWRTRTEVDAELRSLRFVRRRGVRVAAPMRAADGEFVSELAAPEGPRLAALFERAPGSHVWRYSLAQCREYGRLAAGLHDAFDSMQRRVRRFDIDTTHLLDEPIQTIEPILSEWPDRLEFLREMAELVRSKISTLPTADGAYGLCHGDLHMGNIMFEPEGTPTLFDFDCSGYGWRAYDLAVFRWATALMGDPNKSAQTRRWNQFVAGYQERRPLPDGFEEAVPLFLVARTIWVIGLHEPLARRVGGLFGLNDRYFDYWLGLIRGWVSEYPVLRA